VLVVVARIISVFFTFFLQENAKTEVVIINVDNIRIEVTFKNLNLFTFTSFFSMFLLLVYLLFND
jgi:hypothetical protein